MNDDIPCVRTPVAGEILDFAACGARLMKKRPLKQAVRRPASREFELAFEYTRELRGSPESPGKWPILGTYIMELVQAGLEFRELNDVRAARLTGALHSRIEALALSDVSPDRVESMRDCGEVRARALAASPARLQRYRKLFMEPCCRHLRFHDVSLDDFQKDNFWIDDYEPAVRAVFLCIEPTLVTPSAVRAAGPGKPWNAGRIAARVGELSDAAVASASDVWEKTISL